MIDVNFPLRKAYTAALSAIGLPVYYQGLPPNLNPDEYIVFRGIESTEGSTKNSIDTITNITVEIHTFASQVNSGRAVETIANDVYKYIYALPQFILPMDGIQMVKAEFANDRTQDYGWLNGRMYIDRFITFRHKLFIGGTSSMIVNGIGRYTYTATGGETSFTVSDAVGKSAIGMFKDGVFFIPVSGTPIGKQINFNSDSGMVSFDIECEPNEPLYFLYE